MEETEGKNDGEMEEMARDILSSQRTYRQYIVHYNMHYVVHYNMYYVMHDKMH